MKDSKQMVFTRRKYAQLVSFAELDWAPAPGDRVYVSADAQPIDRLTSAHFNLIQENALGYTHLIVWFPPIKSFETPDEMRLMQRAGVSFYRPMSTYG